MKKIISAVENNYRGRLFRAYVNSASRSFDMLWRMIKPFLSKVTVDKVRITREAINNDMWQHINPSQIEVRYGGTYPDRQNFWPLALPPGPYAALN